MNKEIALKELQKRVENSAICALKEGAENTVFADGHLNAPIMVIGEAPGAEEDATGTPFVGRSGRLLSQLLAEAGYARNAQQAENACYITNMVFWRPPANRTPTKAEIRQCLPFVEEHIGIMHPKLLVLVGNVPSQMLLNTQMGVTKIHGQHFEYHNEFLSAPIKAMPVYHPAYILRNPKERATLAQDLRNITQFIT